MGIHGLTSFIDNNPHLLKDHRLHDCRVVIDGNNFYHFLYFYCNVRFQFGGDCDIFRKKVIMIFSLFKSCNIEPFVVFDGAYTADGKKFKTTISRARDRVYAAQRIVNGHRGRLIPCLAQLTFRQTLDMLGVKHVTCDFEADNQIVTLANQLNCSVISNDSDFYIFDLTAGFIPLDYIDFRLCKLPTDAESSADSYNFLSVQYYHADEFIACFRSLSRSVLPLFATMLGNDYVDAAAFESFYRKKLPKVASKRYSASKKHAKIVSVLYWLEEKGSLEEILPEVMTFIRKDRRDKVEKVLRDSIRGYVETQDFESFNLRKFLEGDQGVALQKTDNVKDFHGHPLPGWFLEDVRLGEIPVFLLNVAVLHHIILQTQVECTSMTASFLTSTTLRQVMYGILMSNNESKAAPHRETEDLPAVQSPIPPGGSGSQDMNTGIIEYTRHNLEFRKIEVMPCQCLQRYGNLPALDAIPHLPIEDRQAIMIESLGVSKPFVSRFEPSVQLFVMSVVFWLRNASPKVTLHHLRGILMSVFLLHVHREIWGREQDLLAQSDNRTETEENIDTGTQSRCDPTRKNQKSSKDLPRSGSEHTHVVCPGVGMEPGENVLSLSAVCTSLSCSVLQKVRDNLKKYYHEPVKVNSKLRPDYAIFHGTAQFHACLLDSIHLNCLLQQPFPNPQASQLLNGTFIYSIIHELQNRTNPDLFLLEMIVKGSPLAVLFDSWCSVILSETGEDVIAQKMGGTKCCKRKKKKASVGQGGSEDSHNRDSVSPESPSVDQVVAACDLDNRFHVLMLDESEDA